MHNGTLTRRVVFSFFFFQAEDGIRDIGVTGVQTCALPICRLAHARRACDADADRLAGQGQKLLHQAARRLLMIRAPALDQRDGARDDGALAGADAAREIGKIGNGGSAARRHSFALEPRPLGVLAALPRGWTRSVFYMNLNEITGRQSGSSAAG